MRHAIALAATLLVTVTAGLALATEATVVPGDRISGNLGTDDKDTLVFVVGLPSSLHVKTKLANELKIGMTLTGPDGETVPLGSAYRNPTSKKPALKGVQLRSVGTYRLTILQTEGAGEYDVKLALKSPAPRDINLSSSPVTGAPITIDAENVIYSGSKANLAAENVQDAIDAAVKLTRDSADALELGIFDAAQAAADAEAAAMDTIDTLEEIAAGIDTKADAIDATLADFESQIDDLDSRVDTFDGGGKLTQVLWTLDEPQNVASETTQRSNPTRDAHIVARHTIASVSFEPNQVKSLLVADVVFDMTPTFSAGSVISGVLPNRIVWAKIGDRQFFAEMGNGWAYPVSNEVYQMYGIGTVGEVGQRFDDDARLVVRPTAEEIANGFTLEIYLSAIIDKQPNTDISLDGFEYDVHTAVIRGQ